MGNRLLIVITIVIGVIGLASLGLVLKVKGSVGELERITAPPKINVLTQDIGIGDFSISMSKVEIQELGLNTLIRSEIQNTSKQAKTYIISNRKVSSLQDGYKEIDLNSPYMVIPLTNVLAVDAGDTVPFVILVTKNKSEQYVNTEAWISILQSSSSIQSELILKVLIKGK